MLEPNVTTITEAARIKGCSRQSLYNAIEQRRLTAVEVGGFRMILKDEKFDAFEIQETGGRLHELYLNRRGSSEKEP